MNELSLPIRESEPEVGTVLDGRYRLVEKIGEGGIGWVYRAEHLKLGNPVAVKMLQTQFVGHDLMRPRFEREAKALAMLTHPNVVALTDYSVADNRPYLVMEMLEGRPLSALIDEGPIPVERARPIIRQVLGALAYAHGRGFLHRDLKPDNIFLVGSPKDFVKLLDFGFVKLLDGAGGEASSAVLTRTGVVFGTPAYMSPEQISADKTSTATDVYSLGIVVYEMLAGHRPFRGENTDIVRQHLTTPLPRLRVGDFEASPELHAFLARATAKRADHRFESATEMLFAFDDLPETWLRPAEVSGHAQTLVSHVGEPSGTPTRVSASKKKKRARGFRPVVALVGVLALVAAGLTALLVMREEGAPLFGVLQSGEAGEPARETDDAEPEGAAVATGEDTAAPAVATPPAPAPSAAAMVGLGPSPFASRPRVALLASTERRVERGGTLSEGAERNLKEWARSHAGDPRPHLVLAMHYVNRRYLRDAIERYRLAFRVSPDARNDPRVLAELIRLASGSDIPGPAAETIVMLYGPLARPAIREALEREGLPAAAANRLRTLERRL